MSLVEIYDTQMIPVKMIDLSIENPNEQSDDEFSALVEEIMEHGWLAPVQVIGPDEQGRYKMFGGEHRYKAAQVLGLEEIPGVAVPTSKWDDDVRKMQLVKQNILHGKLNPAKFTELFNELTRTYDAVILQKLMGFTKQDAFERVYEDAKKALPPGMAEKLEEVKEELKTVDDLSLVLNRLFTEYGDTLQFHFMVFSWGGKEHMMVRLSDIAFWKRIKGFGAWCLENKLEMDKELMTRMTWPV